MARLLSCPLCRAEFSFDDWAKATSCPACGRRLSFFEASGQAAPAGAAVAAAPAQPFSPPLATAMPAPPQPSAPPPAVAAAPAQPFPPPLATAMPAPPRSHVYTIGGKALEWSSGWTVVVVIWAIVAVGLVATRVEMGPLTVMTPAERAAIVAVQHVRLPTGASTEAVLRYSATHDLTLEGHVATIPAGGTQMWYAFDRPWEHRIYVYTELPGSSMVGKSADLSWTVADGVATADGATRAALAKAAQTMAHPPSANSVRPIPGIIPSLPPDLQ
jgi:hypothetical protein